MAALQQQALAAPSAVLRSSRPRALFSQLPRPSSCSGRLMARSAPEQQQQQDTGAAAAAPAAGGMQLNEDMLAQLRAAQEEAARLKKELEVLQEQRGPAGGKDVVEGKSKRIDSTDNRETLWGSGKRSAWLSEADVDFFTGGGATEAADTSGPSAEAQAAISKRLLLGGLASAGLAAFALVPTQQLRLKPRQPLFFYLSQLLTAQAQLVQCESLIADAQWDSLRLILPRIKGEPTNAESSLHDAAALLDASTGARAEEVAAEFLEYLDAIDYNKYYDAMPTRTVSGAEAAEFVKFSSAALKAAQAKLRDFLALMPAEQLGAAKAQLAAQEAI